MSSKTPEKMTLAVRMVQRAVITHALLCSASENPNETPPQKSDGGIREISDIFKIMAVQVA